MASVQTKKILKMVSAIGCFVVSAIIFRKRIQFYEIDTTALVAALKKKESAK